MKTLRISNFKMLTFWYIFPVIAEASSIFLCNWGNIAQIQTTVFNALYTLHYNGSNSSCYKNVNENLIPVCIFLNSLKNASKSVSLLFLSSSYLFCFFLLGNTAKYTISLLDLIFPYYSNLPHRKSNMSVKLPAYNFDFTRFPLAREPLDLENLWLIMILRFPCSC